MTRKKSVPQPNGAIEKAETKEIPVMVQGQLVDDINLTLVCNFLSKESPFNGDLLLQAWEAMKARVAAPAKIQGWRWDHVDSAGRVLASGLSLVPLDEAGLNGGDGSNGSNDDKEKVWGSFPPDRVETLITPLYDRPPVDSASAFPQLDPEELKSLHRFKEMQIEPQNMGISADMLKALGTIGVIGLDKYGDYRMTTFGMAVLQLHKINQ